ncbi:MAG: T9SS type A sorting domain-containing protein, partial [Saprospiraceae bacterium]|nr:T9SS type A sorting domain-containing protein [Saprospiraceae bacterium]
FATYFEGLTYEAGLRFGPFRTWLEGRRNNVFQTTDGSVYVNDTTSVSRIFNGRLSYSKGALVLHTIRWVLGDDDFFQALRNYLNDPDLQYGFAKTPDLQHHFEMQSGKDLDYFFQDWIYGEGYPVYTLSWSQDGDQELRLTLHQTPSHPSVSMFEIPVPIQLVGANETYDWVVDNTENDQTFTVNPGFAVEEVIFDPDLKILALFNGEVTSADDVKLSSAEFQIRPNPAQNEVWVEFAQDEIPTSYQVFDLQGKLVMESVATPGKNLNVSGFAPGMYNLKVETKSGKTGIATFVKE